MELRGKTILITGCTSGLGKQFVHQLSQQSRKILVIGRDEEKFASLKELYPKVEVYKLELQQYENVVRTIEMILERHPDLSVVINNAAVQYTPYLSSPNFQLETVRAEIETNLHAPICICALAMQHFLKKSERTAFLNISSGLAIYPKASSATYCATKAALHSFSQSLRYQLEQTNISVFEALLPLVDTPMTKGRGSSKLTPEQAVERILIGMKKDQFEIYVGKAKWIPLLARFSPNLMKRILKSG